MKRPMSPLTRVAVAFAFMVAALGFLAIGSHDGPTKDEPPKWKQRNAQYGIELDEYHRTWCLNGWLVVSIGAHNNMYVRDEEFNPIRCKGK